MSKDVQGNSGGQKTPGRRKNSNRNMTPDLRPKMGKPPKPHKNPKGVSGHTFGGGAKRANAGKKSGCAVTALIILSIPVGTLAGAIYGIVEAVS